MSLNDPAYDEEPNPENYDSAESLRKAWLSWAKRNPGLAAYEEA